MIYLGLRRSLAGLCVVMVVAWLVPVGVYGQSARKGKITGAVYNGQTGDAMIKVGVEVVGAEVVGGEQTPYTKQAVYTGVDGDFSIEVAAGSYKIRFYFEGFNDQVENVTVVAGETVEKSAALTPVGYALGESTTVTAGADSDTITATMEERKASTSIADFISKEEISANPTSTAAGVIATSVGVTVDPNNIVVVRGLGDRYSTQQLNLATLPTPDPERKVVPMDIIPANLLQSVKVLKTFTPDQPGEFSGGLIRLETVEMPNRSSLSVSAEMGFNSQTQGSNFYNYPGSGRDWLGYGAGFRDLPASFPVNQRIVEADRFTPGFTEDEIQQFGRDLQNIWSPRIGDAPTNNSFKVSGAHRFGKFGLVGGFGIKNEWTRIPDEQRNVFATDATLTPIQISSFEFDTSEYLSRIGGTVNLTYDLDSNHKFFFKNFYSNQATNETRFYDGFSDEVGEPLENSRLRYTSESIYSGQLSGRHNLTWLWDTQLTWRYSYARATLDDPALREVTYARDPSTGEYVLLVRAESLAQFFAKMRENVREPSFDLSKFWFLKGMTINAMAGASYTNRDRTFNARRFRFQPRFETPIDFSLSPEALLQPENINPDGFELLETTRGTDHYDALHNIAAGYGMIDLTWSTWRFVGGARVERSIQRVTTLDPFSPNLDPEIANLDNTDVLPSIGVAYNLTPTMALRGGYSKTVCRPQFRELSPFEFTDVFAGYTTFGNPNLVRTVIDNYDLRYEWYVTPDELVAASFFYKKLQDPIETIIGRGQFVRTFANAESARNKGFELELRKNFGFINERLSSVIVNANYTYVSSNVTIAEDELGDLTSKERPLVGQSKNVGNVILLHELKRWSFESRAFFNYTGERIVDVGASGLPDVVEKGGPNLDATFTKYFGGEARPWSLELQLENLQNRAYDYRIGDRTFRKYKTGREVTVVVSYNFF